MTRFWLTCAGFLLLASASLAQNRSADAERFCTDAPCFAAYTAFYSQPVTRYAHAVLGDAVEWGTLNLAHEGAVHSFKLPTKRVFEDLQPRLADMDGDGVPELVVVETDASLGAQLAIYARSGSKLRKLAATPFIGTSYRWLAPAGIADFDGDGRMDVAYIDRPHLAKTLRIWSYEPGKLHEIAGIRGLTNHRIGEAFISGGLRHCAGEAPEIITADANWSRVIATRFEAGDWSHHVRAKATKPRDFAQAMRCN